MPIRTLFITHRLSYNVHMKRLSVRQWLYVVFIVFAVLYIVVRLGFMSSAETQNGTPLSTQLVWFMLIVGATLIVIGGVAYILTGKYLRAAKKMKGQRKIWLATEQGASGNVLFSHDEESISIWKLKKGQPELKQSWPKQSVRVELAKVRATPLQSFPGIAIYTDETQQWSGRLASSRGHIWAKNLDERALAKVLDEFKTV